jgi:hypothetical protein
MEQDATDLNLPAYKIAAGTLAPEANYLEWRWDSCSTST